MTQKVLKVGSSAAVTIPKKWLEELDLEIGDSIIVEIKPKEGGMLIRRAGISNDEVRSWTKKFIERYRPALEALANK